MTRHALFTLLLALLVMQGLAVWPGCSAMPLRQSPDAPLHKLAIQVTGSGEGAIRSTPGSLFCERGDPSESERCMGQYSPGQAILLEPLPAPGSVFARWDAPACNARPPCAGPSMCFIEMHDDCRITAIFERLDTRAAWTAELATGGTSRVTAMHQDRDSLYIAGSFTGALLFERGLMSTGAASAFVARYDLRAGRYVWSQALEGNQFLAVTDIDVDSGEVIVSGTLSGTVDIAGKTLAADEYAGFVVGIRDTGARAEVSWANTIGAAEGSSGSCMVARVSARAGRVVVGGFCEGEVALTNTALTGDRPVSFVASLVSGRRSGQAAIEWSVSWPLSEMPTEHHLGLTRDSSGNILALVPFTGTIASGDRSLTSRGGRDLALIRINATSGIADIRAHIGSRGDERAIDLIADRTSSFALVVEVSANTSEAASLQVHAHDLLGNLIAMHEAGTVATKDSVAGAMAPRPGGGVLVAANELARQGRGDGRTLVHALNDKLNLLADEERALETSRNGSLALTSLATRDTELFAAGALLGGMAGAGSNSHAFVYSTSRAAYATPLRGKLDISNVHADGEGSMVVAGSFHGLLALRRDAPARSALDLETVDELRSMERGGFVARVGAGEQRLWLTELRSTATSEVRALTSHGTGGRVIAAGWFSGALRLNESVVSHGGKDGFVAWLDSSSGAITRALAIGGQHDEQILAAAMRENGGIVVAGLGTSSSGEPSGNALQPGAYIAYIESGGDAPVWEQRIRARRSASAFRVLIDEARNHAIVVGWAVGAIKDENDEPEEVQEGEAGRAVPGRFASGPFVATLDLGRNGRIIDIWQPSVSDGRWRVRDLAVTAEGLALLLTTDERGAEPGNASTAEDAADSVMVASLTPVSPGGRQIAWSRRVQHGCTPRGIALAAALDGNLWVVTSAARRRSSGCSDEHETLITKLSARRNWLYSIPLIAELDGGQVEELARGPRGHMALVTRAAAARPGNAGVIRPVHPGIRLIMLDKVGPDAARAEDAKQ